MQFALNYSLAAAKLFQERRIQIDLFKCPDWDDAVAEASRIAPVYVHFRYQAGRGEIDPSGFERVEHLLEITETAFVNTHFSPLAVLTGEPPDVELAVNEAKKDLRLLGDRFGIERVTVENIPWLSFEPRFSTVVASTGALGRVIRESGAGLLLDIAHARLAAENMSMSAKDYIMELPVDRLREVHVTGVGPRAQGGRIDHMPMTAEDWELFDWTIDQIRSGCFAEPQVVTCEYGGIGEPFASNTSEEVLREQIPRMYDRVKSRRVR